MSNQLPFHPLAEIFPLMEGAEFDALVASIKKSGLRDAISIFDGKILDGRNRYCACLSAGIEPRFVQFTNGDPLRFVVDHNLHRRHLNESQRAMIGARLAQLNVVGGYPPSRKKIEQKQSSNASDIHEASITRQQAASLMNVGLDTITSARTILRKGTPDEIAAVQAGEAAVHTIVKQIRAGKSPTERSKEREVKKHSRQQVRQISAQVWRTFRDALTGLTSLPLAADMVVVVRGNDRSGFVDQRATQAQKWLEDFLHEWTNNRETSTGSTVAGNNAHS